MVLTKPHKAKTHCWKIKCLLLFFICVVSSPTGPPCEVPHVSERGRSWRDEQDGSRGRTQLLSSATFIISIKKGSPRQADTEVCIDEEQYSRSIRCCETFCPLLSSAILSVFLFYLLSRVQSGPHIQQAAGMSGLIPGNSLGGNGVKGPVGV